MIKIIKLTITYKNEITIKEGKDAVLQLLYILYTRDILNYKIYIKKYKYNYTDKQTITFRNTANVEYKFENIPTKWGYLDIYEL